MKDIHYLPALLPTQADQQIKLTANLSRDINDYLASARDLMRHYGACMQPIGAIEAEQKYTAVLEVR